MASTKKRLPRPAGHRSALIVCDMQNDKIGGPVAVPGAEGLIPIINNLRAKVGWDAVILTQDWHPTGHCSFLSTHLAAGSDAVMGDVVSLASGERQKLQPDNCVQDTPGAEFHADLTRQESDKVVRKGSVVDVDSYSGFRDVDPILKTPLSKMLAMAHVTDVYVAGLDLASCVGLTALGAALEGFTTYIVVDGTGAAEGAAAGELKKQLGREGVSLITSRVMLEQLEKTDDRRQEAAAYLEEHNIALLFNKLCTQLVYHKPDDSKAFLIKEIQKLQKQRRSEMTRLTLLTSEDLDTMFNMLDPVGTGKLKGHQIIKALAGLGLVPGSDIDANEDFNVTKFTQLVLTAQSSS